MQIKSLWTEYRYETAIFIIALALRFIFLGMMSSQMIDSALFSAMADSKTYTTVADYFLGNSAVGETYLVLAGPGYGAFLALFFALFGKSPWPILTVQIILSGLAAVLVCRIGMKLFRNRVICVTAGLVAAVSMTSISLANAILSDTLYFFLLALAVWLFLLGIDSTKWRCFIGTGVMLGLATLVRSVGLLFPVVLIIAYFILVSDTAKRKAMSRMLIVMLSVSFVIPGAWAFRNYVKHDIFTVADSGTLAAKSYLAARILYEHDKSKALVTYRNEMYKPLEVDGIPVDPKELHDDAVTVSRKVFAEYPELFVKVYLKNIYENITMQNTLFPIQMAKYREAYSTWTEYGTWDGKQPLILILTLIGFGLLFWKGQTRGAVFLLLIYLYFAALSGVTFWQGSRVFHPAMLSWALCCGGMVGIASWIIRNKRGK